MNFSRPPSAPLPPLDPDRLPAGSEALDATSWGVIWRLSWPLVLTMVCNALVGLLDTWIAGKVSPTSQAAVGLTHQLILLINATTTAVSIGCQALVSRFVGAGDWPEAGKAAQQALLIGFWMTLAVVVPMALLAPYMFQAMGAPPELTQEGTWYLRLLLLALLPMDLVIILNSIFRARGKTQALLLNNLAETGCWSLTSLVLGLWAGWGLNGLAVGFILGKLAGVTTAWLQFRRTRIHSHMPEGRWRLDKAWLRRILAVGLPAGVQVLIRNLGMMAYFAILGLMPRPTETVAAFSIGFRIESIAFLPVFALNIATATLVGQNLGAGRPDHATQAGWRVAGLGVAVMTAFGIFFFLAADTLSALFTQDPVVAHYAADYLRIMALSEPFLALVMVLNGALQGAGATRAPMFATFGAQIVLRLPTAYFLAVPMGWGPPGAWWAMTGSMMIQAVFITWFFRRGTWRERKI